MLESQLRVVPIVRVIGSLSTFCMHLCFHFMFSCVLQPTDDEDNYHAYTSGLGTVLLFVMKCRWQLLLLYW